MPSPEILLIDDDLYASVLRKRVLEHKGYRVQIALDGTTGLALAEALNPALVLFDHNMPGMCGLELLIGLRALLPTKPLVSLSSYDSLADQYPEPPDTFITKGESLDAMLATIAGFLAAQPNE